MWRKVEILEKTQEGLGKLYFNEKDEKVMKRWKEKKCREVLKELNTNNPISFCPFCLYYKDEYGSFSCKDCPYKKITANVIDTRRMILQKLKIYFLFQKILVIL